MPMPRKWKDDAEKKREYRARVSVIDYWQQVLFGWLMDARALGLEVCLDTGLLFPEGTNKLEVWKRLAQAVEQQVKRAKESAGGTTKRKLGCVSGRGVQASPAPRSAGTPAVLSVAEGCSGRGAGRAD
jgi:hypothetical protein